MSIPFSIVVLNWNGKRFLNACLASLCRQTFAEFEIIFVDNGSQDGSVEFVSSNFPEVKVVALPENKGFCGGNNAGIRRAEGHWIALLNNDTRVNANWLAAIDRATREHPDADMFASKMVFDDDSGLIDNCGICVSMAGTARGLGRGEKDGEQFSVTFQPFGPSGGAAFYSRKMLEKIGLLDEDFFLGYEDFDLAFRARLQGFGCRFVADAIVYHHNHGTLRSLPDWVVYYSQRNIEWAYLKNMPLSLILGYGPLRVLYEVGGFLYFARRGYAGPFLRAKIDVLKNLPRILEKRNVIQGQRTVPIRELRNLIKEMTGGWFLTGVRKASGISEEASSSFAESKSRLR